MIYRTASVGNELRQALYSECESYRYALEITWVPSGNAIAVIGLNPSTATELVDDPTLRRVKGFAREWGYGGVRMLNAFALRSTDPKALFKHTDPIGPDNTIGFLKSMAYPHTIAAWGKNIQSKKWRCYYRGHEISEAMPYLQCFRITDSGHPEHPLYLPADLKPVPFSYGANS